MDPLAFGLLGLTDATSKAAGAAGCAGACARSASPPMHETRMPRHAARAMLCIDSLYFRVAVNVPPPRSPAESVPFIASLLSTVPTYFNSTCAPCTLAETVKSIA